MMPVYYLLFCAGTFLTGIFGEAQLGFQGYTKYEPGDINIIITAPHGGGLTPSSQANGDDWPDRKNGCKDASRGTCVYTHSCSPTTSKCSARTVRDSFTQTIARDLADKIRDITEGSTRPHVVYNLLKRSKLDANREINEATLNVPDAVTAYNDYTTFISQAKLAISGSGSGRGFLLDIHGQTHQPPRTELGYLISKSKLVRKSYNIVGTSIRNLGEYWCGSNSTCFRDFVQGNQSLGYFMNQEGLNAVPSPLDKDPNGEKFFSGGYTTRVHGSKDGGNIDAIQLELPRELRFEWNRNVTLKNALANAIVKFYQLNYDA